MTGLFYGDAQPARRPGRRSRALASPGTSSSAASPSGSSASCSAATACRPEVEIAGLDIPEMGMPGYPEFMKVITPAEVPAEEVAMAKAALAKA